MGLQGVSHEDICPPGVAGPWVLTSSLCPVPGVGTASPDSIIYSSQVSSLVEDSRVYTACLPVSPSLPGCKLTESCLLNNLSYNF